MTDNSKNLQIEKMDDKIEETNNEIKEQLVEEKNEEEKEEIKEEINVEDKNKENYEESMKEKKDEIIEEKKEEDIIQEKIGEIKEEKKEDIKEEKKEVEIKMDNKKIITNFEYKQYIAEEPDVNIIYSEDKNNINFMSLELLISELNDNNLSNTKKNINYIDILYYIVYQKNAIMTLEIFFDIIESLFKSNNIQTGLMMLNTYLVNYYSSEIYPKKDIMEKVINSYKLSNKKTINFKIPFDEDKTIEIEKLIEDIKSGDNEIINSLGGMEYIRDSLEPKETIIPDNTSKTFDIFSWDPTEIARQITIYTQQLYRNIECKELLSGGWTKIDKMEKSPNVSKLILRFNKISKWIMEEILSYDGSKDRAKVIEIFISVADELRKMNNLNDCFAVVTTFNHLSIKRLKRSWSKVSPEAKSIQSELNKLCSILKNFEKIKNEFLEYKKNIKNINSIKEGCIPYLAPYLKDLAFLEEGQKYFNQNKLININKIIIVGRIIKNIKESQMFVYGYKPVYALSILSDPDPLDDDKLTKLSESIEPKFTLDRKTKIKRKTNSDIKIENIKSGLTTVFLENIRNYGKIHLNKMSLKDRIKQIQKNYVPISSIETNLVERSLDISTMSYVSRQASIASMNSMNNNIDDNIIKNEIVE